MGFQRQAGHHIHPFSLTYNAQSSFIFRFNLNLKNVIKILRIRDQVLFGSLDPGWKKHPRSYFRELRNSFLGKKKLKLFDADPGSGIFFYLRSGMEKFGSGINIPDPQQKLYCQVNRILWQCFGPGTGD